MDRTTRTFVVMVAGASIPAFMVGFNLGAFGAVFFNQFLAIWAVATATLLAALVPRSRWRPPVWGIAVLALPTAWVALDFFADPDTRSPIVDVLTNVLLLVSLLALPYLVYAIAKLVSPEFFELRGLRLRVGAVAVVAALLGAGVLIGSQNQRFLTCDDFRLSGNDLPPDCAEGDPATQLWEP